MKALHFSKSFLIIFVAGVAGLLPLSGQTAKNVRPLTAEEREKWVIRWNRSDDFSGEAVDWKKWFKKPEDFSGWTWDNEGNVAVKDGVLAITLREGTEGFTSGMLKSYAKGKYGYFEARIKGAAMFPGASPAFWLYSNIDDSVVKAGEVRYSGIDIVELTQRQAHVEGNERVMDHNLHAILANGEAGLVGREWRRPNDKRFEKDQANEYRAPFDPRADFHTYGCRVGKEEIVWYVDGVEVGRKANKFWHRPMSVVLSLGVRAPFVKWENNRLVVNEEAGKGEFPTTMFVDYVRVWEMGD